jgi:2,3-bisphosphoglycerate-dependent phosphoglycerate mutase
MKIYFARHGQSEANVLNEFSNRGRKHPLTALGRSQAEALAESLQDAGITAIYSSPLLRAAQTADIVARKLGLPLTETNALLEFDMGIFEGKSDEASWQHFHNLWAEWFTHEHWDAKVEDGESYNDIAARFMPFMAGLPERHSGETLLLVAHGSVYKAMLPLLINNISRTYALENAFPNCGCVTAEYRDGQWIGLTWDDQPIAQTTA